MKNNQLRQKLKQNKLNHELTWLTLLATFTMGMIDAYTFMAHDQVFASAQTGNMVVFAVKLFTKGIGSAWVNIPVWIAFGLGCFIAQGMLEIPTEKLSRHHQNQIFMVVNVSVLLILAIVQEFDSADYLVWPLGFLSGYELTTFRTVGSITANNGIMTGNSKNMMNSLYQWLIDHDMKAKTKFKTLCAIVVVFVFGVGAGALLCMTNATWPLWTGFGLNLVALLTLFIHPNGSVDSSDFDG